MFDESQKLVAADVMTGSLICARPDEPLVEVEVKLIECRISGLPVVEEGRLVGVISRSDIARVEVLMQSLDGQISDGQLWNDMQADGFQHSQHPQYQGFRQRLDQLKVKDAMRDQVITCEPQTPVSEIAAEMVRQHIHRVIVVVGDRPVGIVSSLDLVKLLAPAASRKAV